MHLTKMHGTPLMANWNRINCCHGHHVNVRVPIDVWGYTKCGIFIE